jgi:flagellar biosynthesis component FlhA
VSGLRAILSPSLALPAGIFTVILLMVMPIPSIALDLFFVLNIALSVAILMAATNAEKPLDFSSFPSVLLFATLLRLALNVASTRVVLLHGHEGESAAGKVIEAFGAFLIGGNFAVGIFVFLILMIINLVVVTKGAGRVSEVSARFTLDALPGKQMAIDSDLAAGLLTADEAKARRVEVATEADFYGSMDGASKFVKGDAVAAVLILMVNIIAGLVLGVISHGLSLADAGARYVTLAVGDALVASVPALLLSIAAAVIVTRVSDARNLTRQIGGQFADPRIWLPVACILGAMGLIPRCRSRSSCRCPPGHCGCGERSAGAPAPRRCPAEPETKADPSRISIEEISDQSLVTIELGYGLVHLADERKGAPLVTRLTGLRRQLCQTFGFVGAALPHSRLVRPRPRPLSRAARRRPARLGADPHGTRAGHRHRRSGRRSWPRRRVHARPQLRLPRLVDRAGAARSRGGRRLSRGRRRERHRHARQPAARRAAAGTARPGPGPRAARYLARAQRAAGRDGHAATALARGDHPPAARACSRTASRWPIRCRFSPACRRRRSRRPTISG